MSDQPVFNVPPAAATVPDPPARLPLIERVEMLEERITQLSAKHNKLVDDVLRELGL